MQANCFMLLRQKRQRFDNAVILKVHTVAVWRQHHYNQLCSSHYTVEVQVGVPAGPTAKCNIMQRSSVVKQYIRNFIFVYLVLPPSKRFISLQWKMQFDSCLFKNYVKGVILATFHADTWTPVSPSFICQRILVQDNTYWFYVLLLWGFLCHSNKGECCKWLFYMP